MIVLYKQRNTAIYRYHQDEQIVSPKLSHGLLKFEGVRQIVAIV